MAKTPELRPLRVGPPRAQGAAVVITRRAADKLRAAHLWVYRTDVEQVQPAEGTEDIAPGSLVTVLDGRGAGAGSTMGTAMYSAASQITLRMVSEEPALSRARYLAHVEQRVEAALNLREQLAAADDDTNAGRLIFSEADNLPGIVVDRYHDILILQLLTQATAQDDVREVLTRVLAARLAPATIVERPDPRVRELEDLPPASSSPLFATSGESPGPTTGLTASLTPALTTTFTLNGLHFGYDAGSGQKTGAFLDQRLNYAAAAKHAHGRALDVCTYQGGFALHLAQACSHVTGVDASRAALEVADRNLERNPGLTGRVDWIEADAFDLLREYDSGGGKARPAEQQFDTIVLDPPAFAKSKRALEGAMRGYKELNLRALRLLRPGGTLVTCSCSHHVSLEEFTGVLAEAAADSHRRVQVLETRGAAPDHPAIVTLPETSYLKCLICRVD